jgi:signal peptidase I
MAERKEPTFGNFDIPADDRRPTPSSATNNKPRKPWLALLLGIVAMPVASAYVGRPALAIVAYVVILAGAAALGWSGATQSVAGIWALMVFAIVMELLMIFLPWLYARRQRKNYALKFCNRWYFYLVFYLIVTIPVSYVLLNKGTFFGFETYRVPSGSMLPTIRIGDLVVADTRPATIAALKNDDLVVHTSAKRPGPVFLKRLIAGPGQHVVITKQALTVDGVVQSREHVQGTDATDANWVKYKDVQLGPDEFFVIGDNRENSLDSRSEGPITRADLRGKITTLYYSDLMERIGALR